MKGLTLSRVGVFVAAVAVTLWGESSFASASNSIATAKSSRPEKWAVPLDRPHLSNLYQVSPDLYRGAQPDAAGMAELKAMGIKTVVDLRGYHSDKKPAAGLGLQEFRIPMEPWHVEETNIVRFLKIMADTNNLPVYVHCQRGADRTGVMCAMYRMAILGWSKDDALQEMTGGGFHFSEAWRNIIRLVRGVDIERVRREAGIGEGQGALNR